MIFLRVKRLLRIVRPSYEFSNNTNKPVSISQKPISISSKTPVDFPKPREKISQTLEKLHSISQQFYKTSQDAESFSDIQLLKEQESEETVETQQKLQEKVEETTAKSKVYGVSSKPKPRNFKEKDVEKKKNNENSEWLPPKNQRGDGFTNLNAKYGY